MLRLRLLARRIDRYMLSRESSVLGTTLVVCSPMIVVLWIVVLVIDLR